MDVAGGRFAEVYAAPVDALVRVHDVAEQQKRRMPVELEVDPISAVLVFQRRAVAAHQTPGVVSNNISVLFLILVNICPISVFYSPNF